MTGIELIAAERKRQIEVEGWTPEHDDQHNCRELALAAVAYIEHYLAPDCPSPPWTYPVNWDRKWWKPSPDPQRDIVKACALLAAELDRLQRKANGG